MEPLRDEELMLRYRDGDASAFDALYARHRAGLFRFILRQCPSRGEAEEIFQEVWMRLIEARSRYRVEARFSTYLYQIAVNRLIDRARRKSSSPALSLDDPDCPEGLAIAPATGDPMRLAAAREQGARLLACLGELPPEQREAFLLHEEGGLSVREIAEVTRVGPETAKSRLRYALQKLRQALGGRDE
ncbi:MAG: RNA polymerase sigma factor [Burkholderiales bacterium]